MGFINRIFGKGKGAPKKNEQGSVNLALVLLSEASLLDSQEIMRAFREFAAPDESLQLETDDGKQEQEAMLFFKFSTGGKSVVALSPFPVPEGEADQVAQFSLSSFANDWKLPPHDAYFLVTLSEEGESPPAVRLSRLTSLLAAVTKLSPAVGVYWGNAGATHSTDFFLSVASEQGITPRIMLWSGLSIARENDGRLSILSLGMKQLDLPDLLLVAGESSEGVAIETLYDLLAYVADRGEALPEGDTVGRTAQQHLPVRYVPSPVDPSTKVWRVELP